MEIVDRRIHNSVTGKRGTALYKFANLGLDTTWLVIYRRDGFSSENIIGANNYNRFNLFSIICLLLTKRFIYLYVKYFIIIFRGWD